MALFRHYLRIKVEALRAEDARLRFAGRLEGLPDDIREILADSERRTREGGAIQVVVCLNYGGRQEILDAVNRLLRERREEDGPIDEAAFRSALYLPDLPDPDLLIRTSGELRMSNFWLYEGAYSEYYFTDLLWPDFGMDELRRALEDYAGRERRYGRT
jgi:undecaprenyl diphosphate synthase